MRQRLRLGNPQASIQAVDNQIADFKKALAPTENQGSSGSASRSQRDNSLDSIHSNNEVKVPKLIQLKAKRVNVAGAIRMQHNEDSRSELDLEKSLQEAIDTEFRRNPILHSGHTAKRTVQNVIETT